MRGNFFIFRTFKNIFIQVFTYECVIKLTDYSQWHLTIWEISIIYFQGLPYNYLRPAQTNQKHHTEKNILEKEDATAS